MKGWLSKFLPVRPKIQLEGRSNNAACVLSSSSYSRSVSNPLAEVHLVMIWPGNWIIRSRTDLNVVGLCPPRALGSQSGMMLQYQTSLEQPDVCSVYCVQCAVCSVYCVQ